MMDRGVESDHHELCPDLLKSSHLRILSCCSTEKHTDAKIGMSGTGSKGLSPVDTVLTAQCEGAQKCPFILPLSHLVRISFSITCQWGSTYLFLNFAWTYAEFSWEDCSPEMGWLYLSSNQVPDAVEKSKRSHWSCHPLRGPLPESQSVPERTKTMVPAWV